MRLRSELARIKPANQQGRPGNMPDKPVSGQPVLLTSQQGRRYVGDQLKLFDVDAEGAIGTSKDAWLSLHNTECKAFRLTGQVWAGGPSPTLAYPEDLPDGFALYIREWDGLHRYAATTQSILVKRRRWAGNPQENDIVEVAHFQEPPQAAWIPFSLEVTADRISFQIGTQTGVIAGPLDSDGANKIALAPGSKVKDVTVQILPGPDGEDPEY